MMCPHTNVISNTAASRSNSARREQFWTRLLNVIAEGMVVPVIGARLLTWEGMDGQPKSLQSEVARQLLTLQGVDPDAVPLSTNRELHDAVSHLKQLPGANLQYFYSDISDAFNAVLAEPDFRTPAALIQLADISDFRLLVTSAPYPLLARALRKHCAVNEIVHSPYLPTSQRVELAPDWFKRSGEVNLLYLFGRLASTMVYAIHDEDILEYAHNLFCRGSNVPGRFLEDLQQMNLLLIGCNFPDWLSRFFIRLTNKERLADKKTRAWLVEEAEGRSDLTLFLHSYSRETEVLSDISPQAFVAELHDRWIQRSGGGVSPAGHARPAGPDPNKVIFFISYSRATDLVEAGRLYKTLRDLGAAEREIWFDETSIDPGQDFQKLIFEGIRNCRYFLPVISAKADQRKETFFYSEWRAALERDKTRGFGEELLVTPIIVDSDYKPRNYKNVPPEWVDRIHFGHAPDGVPDQHLNEVLTERIRAFRRGGASTFPPTEVL